MVNTPSSTQIIDVTFLRRRRGAAVRSLGAVAAGIVLACGGFVGGAGLVALLLEHWAVSLPVVSFVALSAARPSNHDVSRSSGRRRWAG